MLAPLTKPSAPGLVDGGPAKAQAAAPAGGTQAASAKPAPGRPAALTRGNRQLRHLAQSVLLEESGVSGLLRGSILIGSAAVFSFVAWAALTPVPETSVSRGQIVPSGMVETVAHLEGGIVAATLVQDGDLVERNQPLVRLDPISAQAELAEALARRADLRLRAERLRALAADAEPDWAVAGDGWPLLVAQQQAGLDARRRQLAAARAVLEAQIGQHEATIRLHSDQLAGMAGQIALVTEVLGIREKLLRDGLQSRVVYLDNRRELARLEGERARINGEVGRAVAAIAEARQRIEQEAAAQRRDHRIELETVALDLAALDERVVQLRDRARRLAVEAPVRGLVQGLRVTNAGAVLAPGATIAEIVPLDRELRAEVRVSPRDIGHIRQGQPVKVKVSTFDHARYGSIDGKIASLSPTTFTDERHEPYYKAWVSLDRSHLGETGQQRHDLLPGMTVQADITTGQKTVLAYLLRPVYVALEQGFHER